MSEFAALPAVDVLLVEDDPGDVLMTREAFEHFRIPNTLHVVADGELALQFVRKIGEFRSAQARPDLARPEPPPPQWARGTRRA